MAIERRERLHDVQIMAHSAELGGQYVVEQIDWDTEKDAMVPGSGVLLPPQAITTPSGEIDSKVWAKVRDMLDLALIVDANEARAEIATVIVQRDRANVERDAAMATAREAIKAKEIAESIAAAADRRVMAAEVVAARALTAAVVEHGT